MKRVNHLMGRRQFAKLAGSAVLVAPLAPALTWRQESKSVPAKPEPASPGQQAEPAKPEPKLKLTKEQEERVKQALERRDRQLAAVRSHTLPYSAEPAFVFRVRLPEHRRNVRGRNAL